MCRMITAKMVLESKFKVRLVFPCDFMKPFKSGSMQSTLIYSSVVKKKEKHP